MLGYELWMWWIPKVDWRKVDIWLEKVEPIRCCPMSSRVPGELWTKVVVVVVMKSRVRSTRTVQ